VIEFEKLINSSNPERIKVMKRTLNVTIALLMILIISACSYGNQTNDENLLGTWELKSVTVDGIAVDLTVDKSAMIPYDYTFTFLEKGNAVADVLGVSYTTTYQVTDGIITFSDAALSPLRLVIDGDSLLLKNDITRTTLTFNKQ
jgi:hypothetical protein